MKGIPLWIKVAYTIFLLSWVGYYLHSPADWDFKLVVWFCYVGLLVTGVALWLDNALLVSWQAVSLVVVQLVFTLDVMWRIVFGKHLADGLTEYMFNEEEDATHRLLSWFHTPMPFLLIWAVWRLGYDRRAIWVQIAASWVLLLLAYFFTDPADNVNFVFGPTSKPQTWVSSRVYLLFCMWVYPLVLYLPAHSLFCRLMPPPKRMPAKWPARAAEVLAEKTPAPQNGQVDGQGDGHVYERAQPD